MLLSNNQYKNREKQMKKQTISTLKILIAIITLILVLIYTAIYFVDVSKYKSTIETKASETTGRKVQIGDIKMSPGLKPRLSLRNVVISNAEWIKAPTNMVEIEKLEFSLKIIPFLKGNVEVDSLHLDNANISLEKNKDGKANWEFETDTPINTEEITDADFPADDDKKKDSGFNPIDFYIGDVRIKNTNIAYKDAEQSHELDIDDITIEADSKSSPISIRAFAEYNKQPLDIRGRFLSLGNIINPSKISHSDKDEPINMHVKYAKHYLKATGNIKNIQELSGINLDITLQGKEILDNVKSMAESGKKLGAYNISTSVVGDMEKLALPKFEIAIGDSQNLLLKVVGKIQNVFDEEDKGLTAKTKLTIRNLAKMIKGTSSFPYTEVTARLYNTDKVIFLDDIKGEIGDSDFKGNMDFDLSKTVPEIEANFTSKLFNTYAILKGMHGEKPYDINSKTPKKKRKKPSKSKEENSTDELFSKTPFELTSLKAVNINFNAKFDKLITPQKIDITNLNTGLSVHNGTVRYFIEDAVTSGGTVDVDINATPVRGNLNTSIMIRTSKVNLGPIISTLQKKKGVMRDGATDTTIKIKSSGKSMHQLAANAQGKILIHTQEATIAGKLIKRLGGDLLSNMASLLSLKSKNHKTSKNTALKCAVINMDVNKGIMTSNKGIAFETDVMNAVATGNIDLGKEEIDMKVSPYPQGGLEISVASMVGQLLRISGTLTNPSVGISKAGVAKSAVTIGAAVATGGISLLGQKLVGTVTEDESPCTSALRAKK